MMRKLAALCCLFAVACSEMVPTPTSELSKLNDFSPAMIYHLKSSSGEQVEFNKKSKLELALRDGRELSTQLSSLHIDGDTVRIVPRNDGEPIALTLSQVNSMQIQASVPVPMWTWVLLGIFAVVGISLGVGAAIYHPSAS